MSGVYLNSGDSNLFFFIVRCEKFAPSVMVGRLQQTDALTDMGQEWEEKEEGVEERGE